MADKEINDLTSGGAIAAGDIVHIVRSGNSRKGTLGDAAGKNIPFTAASTSGPASLEFAEDADNGSNKVTVQSPSTLATDVLVTLPNKAGTLALESDVDRRNALLSMCDNAKALVGYQRYLDTVAIGFAASGDVDAGSSTGTVAGGAWKPSASGGGLISPSGLTTRSDFATNTAAAFDGTTSQDNAGSAGRSANTSAYIGKSLGTSSRISVGRYYPSNQSGVVGGGTSTFEIQLRAKTGAAPSNFASDGVLLGTTGAISDRTTVITITNTGDTATAFDHWWFYISKVTGSTDEWFCAEAQVDAPSTTSNATLITPYQTTDATRAKVRGVFEIDNNSSAVLGTDWTVEFTCNGGTSWTGASTYTDCGRGQAGRKVIETEEVTCTSGTSFAARVKNLNNKRVDVYKAALRAAA